MIVSNKQRQEHIDLATIQSEKLKETQTLLACKNLEPKHKS